MKHCTNFSIVRLLIELDDDNAQDIGHHNIDSPVSGECEQDQDQGGDNADEPLAAANDDEGEMPYTQDMLGDYSTHMDPTDQVAGDNDFDMASDLPPPPPPPPSTPVRGLNRRLFNSQQAPCKGEASDTIYNSSSNSVDNTNTRSNNIDSTTPVELSQQVTIKWNSPESSLLKHTNSIRLLDDNTAVIPFGPVLRLSEGCHLGFTKKVPPKNGSRGRKTWYNIRFGRAYAPDPDSGEYTKIFFFDLTCPEAKTMFSNQPELIRIIEDVTKQPDPPSSWVSSEELVNVGN